MREIEQKVVRLEEDDEDNERGQKKKEDRE